MDVWSSLAGQWANFLGYGCTRRQLRLMDTIAFCAANHLGGDKGLPQRISKTAQAVKFKLIRYPTGRPLLSDQVFEALGILAGRFQ